MLVAGTLKGTSGSHCCQQVFHVGLKCLFLVYYRLSEVPLVLYDFYCVSAQLNLQKMTPVNFDRSQSTNQNENK